MASGRRNREPIFVGGAGRSGTTLLRVILDSHPNIACGPELKVIGTVCGWWHELQTSWAQTLAESHLQPAHLNKSFARLITSLLDENRRATGKTRAAEKSPNNIFYFAHLHCLFPGSPLIHVLRDGRDVVCSLLTMPWVDMKTGERLSYTRDAAEAAKYWADAVAAGRTAAQNDGVARRYHELRYEDLVSDPEPVLRRLFEFLEEPWDPAVLNFHETQRNLAGESSADQVSKPLYKSASGRWRRDLTGDDKDRVKQIIGPLLIDLGYAVDMHW